MTSQVEKYWQVTYRSQVLFFKAPAREEAVQQFQDFLEDRKIEVDSYTVKEAAFGLTKDSTYLKAIQDDVLQHVEKDQIHLCINEHKDLRDIVGRLYYLKDEETIVRRVLASAGFHGYVVGMDEKLRMTITCPVGVVYTQEDNEHISNKLYHSRVVKFFRQW